MGFVTGLQNLTLTTVFSLDIDPLDEMLRKHRMIYRTHIDMDCTIFNSNSRQMLFAAGFHGVGEQLLHLFAAADQRNACVMDGIEPRYHSGQIVWVKRCEELECGDIGIFVYDDCGYLKKYDEHTPDKSQAEFLTDSYGVVHNQPVLVSLNTKYSPILISPEQRFEVVGKVLN